MNTGRTILSGILLSIVALLLFIQPVASAVKAAVNILEIDCCPECSDDGACKGDVLCSCSPCITLYVASGAGFELPLLEISTPLSGEVIPSESFIFSTFHPPTAI